MAPRGRPPQKAPSAVLAAVHQQHAEPQVNPLIVALAEARGGTFSDRDIRTGIVIGTGLGFLLGRVTELVIEADKAIGSSQVRLIADAQYYLGLAAAEAEKGVKS